MLTRPDASRVFQERAGAARSPTVHGGDAGIFLDGASGSSGVQQTLVGLPEVVDPSWLQQAWQIVQGRHEVLRASSAGEEAQAAPHADVKGLAVAVHDLTEVPRGQRKARLSDWLRRDRAEGFPPDAAPALRLNLFQNGEEDSTLVCTYGQVLLDGQSTRQVLAEVFDAYSLLKKGHTVELPAVVPFSRHLERLAARDFTRSEVFFKNQLAGFEEPTPLPQDGLEVFGSPVGNGELVRRLDEDLASALSVLARDCGVTLNVLFQAAWACLLGRYSGSDDVVFGGTRACRTSSIEGAESIVGCLVNTLPLRAKVDAERTVRDLLNDLEAQGVALGPHEQLPLARIEEASGGVDSRGLFESSVVFEGATLEESLRSLGGDWARRTVSTRETTRLPLSLAVYWGDTVQLRLEFRLARFSPISMDPLLDHLIALLSALTQKADRCLRDLEMLTPKETKAMVSLGQGDPLRSIPGRHLHDSIFEHADRNPEKIAVRYGETAVTYAELAARAERVARQLISRGVCRGDRVGICCNRGMEFAAGILGILSAGAAYVPLDPAYPAERLAYMVKDSGAAIVLTHEAVREHVPDGAEPFLVDLTSTLDVSFLAAPPSRIDVATPAYVIYTSGSTGKPKGVPIHHAAVVNTVMGMMHLMELTENDIVGQMSSISFDASVEEMFATWNAGAELVFRPEQLMAARELSDWITERGISVIDMPTAYWHEWVRGSKEQAIPIPPCLRVTVVGGEKASAESLQTWMRLTDSPMVWINAYGPTETTITATTFTAQSRKSVLAALTGEIPIGRPIPNTKVFVLDSSQRLLPRGAPGELYIGGKGLAAGYLGRQELTAERFLDVDIQGESHRLYRTGDRVRWNMDGDLMYLGRDDDQVKLNGYRIELGEVQRAMRAIKGVDDAAVVVRDSTLCGYFVTKDPHMTPPAARKALQENLPAFMVPGRLQALDALPVKASGKVDLTQLPEPERVPAAGGVELPTTVTELAVAEALSLSTPLEAIGVHENFFELGVTSLHSLRVLDHLNAIGLRATPQLFFQHPSISKLSAALDALLEGAEQSEVVSLQPKGEGTPLFLFHSVPGDLLGYGGLVHGMSLSRPCYGIQAAGLLDPSKVHHSIQDMSEHYADLIAKKVPQGPVLLGGWCFGGLLALETAGMLRERGRTVERVLLLEAYPEEPRARSLFGKARQLLARGPVGWHSYLGKRSRAHKEAVGDEAAQFALDANAGFFKHRALVRDANLEAVERYSTTRYSGPVLAIRARENPDPRPDYGWGHYLDDMELVTVDGFHETLLAPENVGSLVAAIEQRI